MLNKIKKVIKKWLGIPEDLIYRVQTLNNWSMENERRRHLLHNTVEGNIKGLKKMSIKIAALENKIEQFQKKEHALQRHFGIKYLEYFTYAPASKKVQHYALEINGKIEEPVIGVEGDIAGGNPPWKKYPMESYADEKYKASVSPEEVALDKEIDEIICA